MNHIHIPDFSTQAAQKAKARLDSLAKLPGSLGQLEELCVHLAGITGNPSPSFPQKSVVLFAADHDIALQGVSATGQEVTAIQVRNFTQGGGAINALCRNAGAQLVVVDVGIKTSLEGLSNLVQRKIVFGAKDFSKGPAMNREEALACLQVGIDMARQEAEKGVTLLAAGEMGIGNTSPSSAIAAVLTGLPVKAVTGMGSGLTSDMLRLKTRLITEGIALNNPNPKDPVDVLAKVGGPEIGAMAGLMLGGAALRIPVLVDGFIAGAAATLAVALFPKVRPFLLGSHLSKEPGHSLLMQHLGMTTYLDFGMRLGEGTGAALMFPLVDASVRVLHEMVTLQDLDIHMES